MDYADKFSNVTVLGAAGKMGSGILLLTAIEMTELSLKPENRGKPFVINAVDVSSEALFGLMGYVRAQVLKAAEKKVVALRVLYADRADLIENGEIIEQFINDVMARIRPALTIDPAFDSTLVFEAIKEDPALKVKILSEINKKSKTAPWFFTNTSSIPIGQLNKDAGLDGRVLGVHFYNPPAVQRLVEIIAADKTKKELVEFAELYSKNLRKIVVHSNDFAGFVGNGHFMRDALYGIKEAEKLAEKSSIAHGIYTINRVTQDYLIRPMGIFQLIDYVGIDVCQYIMSVMNPHLPDEDLHSDMLDTLIKDHKVLGGQNSDGSQKDGILKYERNRPVAIFDIKLKKYVPITDVEGECNKLLGAPVENMKPWKSVIGDSDKESYFKEYFAGMKKSNTAGADIARRYSLRSRDIGKKLVADKVALSEKDVNTVLLTGFFHAYGPINDYLA
jgi:3-hydroxyacyl-CoA dehydrogenase